MVKLTLKKKQQQAFQELLFKHMHYEAKSPYIYFILELRENL